MEQKQQKRASLFSSRKFKYGAVATAFTALFIVAVILLNVIVSAIDSKYSLYVDLTSDQVFSVSDSSLETIRGILDEAKEVSGADLKITVTFLRARDMLIVDEKYRWVVNLAESYQAAFPEITLEFKEDLLSHPENYTYYTDFGYVVNQNSILVSSSVSKAAFQIFNFDSCLVYDESGSNVWAFQGEVRFNSAIRAVTSQESPSVSFTTGHGESKPEALVEIFLNAGFKVEYVDLLTEDISDETKILILSNPQKDIIALDNDQAESEYSKISDYLNDYRSLVVIASPSMPPLPVLDELMADWGMEVVRNQIVMDDSSSVPGDNKMLYVNYKKSDKVSSFLTDSLTALSSPPRTISYLTAPVNILFEGDGKITAVDAVLQSSGNSYVEVATENGTLQKKQGPYNLMAMSSKFTIIDNNNVYGHMLVIGSANFTETSAYRSEYGNTDIVYNIIRLLSKETLVMKADYKVLDDTALTIQTKEVYTYGIIASIVIPVIVFSFGIYVYIKRKHL